ncbi:MAG: hypothetical protein MUO72_09695 [Bacteroidales bacterium]|nr:hypothetical protein [Bacteroidales bacterium]
MDNRKIDFEDIKKVIFRELMISEDKAGGKTRKGEMVFARQLCWYFGVNYTILSLSKLGRNFNRDHSTVINGVKTIQNYIDTNYKEISKLINYLKNLLGLNKELPEGIVTINKISDNSFIIVLNTVELKKNNLTDLNMELLRYELERWLQQESFYNNNIKNQNK